MAGWLLEHWAFVVFVTAIGSTLGLARLLLRDGPAAPPYVKRPSLLDERRRRVFAALRAAVGAKSVIVPSVRLLDVVHVPEGERRADRWLGRLDGKQLDFVVCHARTLEPQLAVQLAEPTAQPEGDQGDEQANDAAGEAEPARTAGDAAIDEALAAAGVPLVCVASPEKLDKKQLAAALRSL